jgi:hypothetical protein
MRVIEFVGGVALVLVVLDSAVRTFVLPRGSVVRLTRLVWLVVRRAFNLAVRFTKTYEGRDRVMALYAPVTLMVLPGVWLVMVETGFTLMLRGLGVDGWRQPFIISGSSMLTLGFDRPPDLPTTALAFCEASIGLAVVALLIAYLPSIYGVFSRREVLVAQLSARAGTPPSAVEFLERAHLIGKLDQLDDVWRMWQIWFAEVEETHTSQASLVFLRSPRHDRSWITAAGVVLDAASLVNSTIDVPWSADAALCVRSGYSALRAVTDFFSIPYDPDPRQSDPTSIAREEYDDACRRLEAAGVALKPDRDQAWLDFNGWRVTYDAVLIQLCALTMAPYAMWSSDRSLRSQAPALLRLRTRVPRP